MSDFIFRVQDFHLTKEQENRIAGSIRAAVATELARLDLSVKSGGGSSQDSCIFIPILWNGGRLLLAAEVAGAEGEMLTVKESGGQG